MAFAFPPASPGPAQRPPPLFLGDHLAMDLLNTRAVPGGVDVEWLADGRDLAGWLSAAGLAVPDATARQMDAIAGQVRDLREAFRRFVDRHAGRPLTPAAARGLVEVNGLLVTDDAYRQVEPGVPGDGPPLVWRLHRRSSRPSDVVLLPLADAIGDLVTTADFTLVRRCQGQACTLQFLDRTKSHARRWCSMAGCGNRAKAAAHRARGRRAGDTA
jgi:predicted RNA-binding Zn ribbon-like protein